MYWLLLLLAACVYGGTIQDGAVVRRSVAQYNVIPATSRPGLPAVAVARPARKSEADICPPTLASPRPSSSRGRRDTGPPANQTGRLSEAAADRARVYRMGVSPRHLPASQSDWGYRKRQLTALVFTRWAWRCVTMLVLVSKVKQHRAR